MVTTTAAVTLADARSLGQKLAELGARLPTRERILLTALLRQALRAPAEDVRGFIAEQGGQPDADDWLRLAPLDQDWLDEHSDILPA